MNHHKPMRLLNDNPTIDDRLWFGDAVDVLTGVITGATGHPLTIGVFGGWGSGKTSLMKMVEKRLADVGVKTVWFNAWKYDGKETIWNALIQTIFLAMKRDAGPGRDMFKQQVIHASKELAKYAAKVATRFVPGGMLREEDVDAVLAAIASGADDELFEFVNRFENEFDALVRQYVGAEGYLVVFIDDLDRCLPDNAIEVMEALKLYLDRANCVFVVGAEPEIIEEAIRRRYNDNPSLAAVDYLEKIIQVPFVLPRMRTDMALRLADDAEVRHAFAGDVEMARLIRIGTNRNPRRVKRLFNAFTVASRSGGDLSRQEQRSLAKILVIQMRFPRFYRELAQNAMLIEKLTSGDRAAWIQEGVGSLYEDFALRRFLKRTQAISGDPQLVRRWIRLSGMPSQTESDLEDAAESDSGRSVQ